MNERQSAEVKVYDVAVFEAKVKELNRKAAKAGVLPVTYSFGSEWVKEQVWQPTPWSDGEPVWVTYLYKVVKLSFDVIQYDGGWQLAGVIDHQEGLVKSVPGSTIGLQVYKERGAVCDHCHTSRDRKETFVLVNETGEAVQVGRSCLHLFLGIDAERALAGAGLSSALGGLGDEEWSGPRQPFGYSLGAFLASAVTMIRLNGWRSRSAVYNGGAVGRSTADQTWDNLDNAIRRVKDRYGVPLWEDSSPEDAAVAKQVEAWLKGLVGTKGLNDYQSNLAQVGQNDFVSNKSAGFAASAVVAWGKEREAEIKRAAERLASGRANDYVGHVGDKVKNIELTLVKSPGFETDWGYTFIHRFVDEFGRVFTWRTATGLDLGKYVVSATIKAHEEYKGEKQTVITRAKTVRVEVAAA